MNYDAWKLMAPEVPPLRCDECDRVIDEHREEWHDFDHPRYRCLILCAECYQDMIEAGIEEKEYQLTI